MCGVGGGASLGARRFRSLRVRVFLTSASVCALALLGVPAALATTVTIPVEADTYVSGTSPDANFGDSGFFDTYGGKNLHCLPAVDYTAPAYGLLRFDLDSVPAGRQLIDARVYTTTRAGYAQDGDPYHHLIYIPNDAWGESTVTFNTRPPDGTVAPGDPTLAAFPGTDIRTSAFSVGSSPVFRDFCTTDPGVDESHVFPDLADTVFKPAALSESDFLSHLSADRANTDDTKISLEVYTPNCAVCTVGTDLSYWSRYVTKEDASRPVGARPHLVVTYADISTQASAPSPATTGGNVTYSATFTNDGTIDLPLSSVIARIPAGFSYVPGSSSANLNGDPTVAAGVATWNRDAADLGPGEKLDVSFALEAAGTPGSYDVEVSGSVGFESPYNVGQATVSIDVVAAVPTGVTAGLDSGDGTSVEAGADDLDIFELPLEAIIHPASSPITQQPITQQPITQQPSPSSRSRSSRSRSSRSRRCRSRSSASATQPRWRCSATSRSTRCRRRSRAAGRPCSPGHRSRTRRSRA